MPRLIYSMCRVQPPMEDLYTIPGFEHYRDGIKKVMSSLMFIPGPIKKMPKGTRELFPKEVKIGEVVRAIEATHPALRAAFATGAGHRCQYLESQILMSVLERLREHGITALPIHDAVLVPASAANIAQQVMLDVFNQQTGAAGVVEVVGR